MTEPFFERLHIAGEFADADGAVAYKPSNEHDRQSCAKTENDRHKPTPGGRQRECNINHRQEINETVRTESDSEKDTEDE